MKKITKAIIMKGLKQDKYKAYEHWQTLKQLIKEADLPIKNDTDYEMNLYIEGEPEAYIELFPDNGITGFVQIHLWHYNFKSEPKNNTHNRRKTNGHHTLYDALSYINTILDDIENDKA